ncbi:MAG: tripartite tricarboxylate transporter substrate binding protein [Opitutales bacterium]
MSISTTKSLVGCIAVTVALFGVSPAASQEFPSKPITIINGFAAGGATDVAIRGLTANAPEIVDQPIVIETVTGAGGVTAMLQVMQSSPDGHTLLVADTVLVTLPLFQEGVPVSVEGYRPVGVFNRRGAWLLTRPAKGWDTLEEFVAAARERPGELTVGVPSLGSPQQLAVVAIEDTFDIDVNIIPYSGGAPTMAALLGDQIDAAMPGTPAGLDSINAGEAVFLVASTDLELPEFEGEFRTFADVGVPHDLGIWAAIWAPKDTPDDVMSDLADIFGEMAQSREWADFAAGYGVTPVWLPLDEASSYIAASAESMAKLAALIE